MAKNNGCTKFIGVVADIKRDAENDYQAVGTCLFGLEEEELIEIQRRGVETRPKFWTKDAERYMIRVRGFEEGR